MNAYSILKSIFLILVLFNFSNVFAQNKNEDIKFFDGFYIGIHAGSQNLFGGSFVDGVDILAQESRFVMEFPVGFRKQFFKDRLLVGIEAHLGITDGNLSYSDPVNKLYIDYKNNSQSGIGLTLGGVIGKRKNILLYVYGNETKRNFDVSIREPRGAYQQRDEQGMLRYGVGLETHIYKGINARISAGRLRVDFGDLETNINVEDKMDFMIGLNYQF